MHTIIYFSPTGKAKHLAQKLAAELNIPEKKMHALEFTDPNKLESEKHLILLYPVHGFNAPRTVKRFVKGLPPGLFEAISPRMSKFIPIKGGYSLSKYIK